MTTIFGATRTRTGAWCENFHRNLLKVRVTRSIRVVIVHDALRNNYSSIYVKFVIEKTVGIRRFVRFPPGEHSPGGVVNGTAGK